MNYKKFIKSRAVRIKIMQALSFVPDELMLKFQYRIKTGHSLNLKNPQRYTEKLQWYKLYYRDPLMAQCVDKYEVRKYVEGCGLGNILNECYGVYDSPEQIDFDALPNEFVLKDTLGGGGNSIIICQDKKTLDISKAVEQMKEWTKPTYGKHPGREWVYDGKKHRIIAERYIPSDHEKGGLIDYKFFCFYGRIYCLYVMSDRSAGLKMRVYDSSFKPLDAYIRYDIKDPDIIMPPSNYKVMCEIVKKLSSGFPHVRIDLYDQDGTILFGETTFFSGSGYTLFDPDEFDFEMGKEFELPVQNTSCRRK